MNAVRISTSRRSHRRQLWCVASAVVLVGYGLIQTHVNADTPPRGGPAQVLTAADVTSIVAAAAGAIADDGLAVAVVDRKGTILGVYRRSGATSDAPDVAVSLARTTAFFSNDQAPLSSRTVRAISGIHFPAGVRNTPSGALYGVENINRGCDLDPQGLPLGIDRPRAIQTGPLPPVCNAANTSGCARGGAIFGEDGKPVGSLGITTGKRNILDTDNGNDAAVNPGGIPLYRGGHLIGGVGVAGVPFDRAEYAALIGSQAAGITTALAFPAPIPTPGAVYIEGIRLPFYSSCSTNIACIQAAARTAPAGSSKGVFEPARFVAPPINGGNAPEGYLIGPRASLVAGGLSVDDVTRIVNQSIAQANAIRAQVRLPIGQTPTFVIAVTDEGGRILAEYRMTDALFDAVDVVPSKARNAYYFSTPEGYQVLKASVTRSPEGYSWTPDPPGGAWAVTSRTLGFGGQPLFPSGIDLEPSMRMTGPWFDLFVYDSTHPCTEGTGPHAGRPAGFSYTNGITWFPGSAPLYKAGRLVGGLGVSGDGIEENDFVTSAGVTGFDAPAELRVDNSSIRTRTGATVRLPYWKFPRNPTIK